MSATLAVRYLGALLLWPVPDLAQPEPRISEPTQQPAVEILVKGSVRDGDSGWPVSGARVSLTQSGTRKTVSGETDLAGAFRILLTEPGTYFASAAAAGYVQPSHFNSPIRQVQVSAGTEAKTLELILYRPAAVTGRLVDEASEKPICGFQVRAHAAAYREGRLALVPASRAASTDTAGAFYIDSLAPGEYLLEITPPDAETIIADRLPDYSEANSRPSSYSRTLWPLGGTDRFLSSFPLHSGQQLDLGKLWLARHPMVRVLGSLGGTSCLPSYPVTLVLMQRYGGISILRTQKKVACGSEFAVANLAPGANYQLAAFQVAETAPGALLRASASFVTEVSVSTEDLELPVDLANPRRIRGRIDFPADFKPDPQLTVRLRPVRGYPIPGEERPTVVDRLGRFELAIHARTGEYELVIDRLKEPYSVNDIYYNGSKLTGMIFSPNFSALDHSLEIVISASAATLNGSVYFRDQAVGGAFVVIAPWPLQLKEGYPIYETSESDQNGIFRKGGLRPGTYRVLAVIGSSARTLHRPYELIQLLSAAQQVDLSERSERSLRLDLLFLP